MCVYVCVSVCVCVCMVCVFLCAVRMNVCAYVSIKLAKLFGRQQGGRKAAGSFVKLDLEQLIPHEERSGKAGLAGVNELQCTVGSAAKEAVGSEGRAAAGWTPLGEGVVELCGVLFKAAEVETDRTEELFVVLQACGGQVALLQS